ncbi:hypothetical protein [Leisingera sp. ANG59]|uniref:hypothetical protein n=1 Tax=Leisingera sp. ANG59 TaxID=2675221 RepID=UPI0015725E12|nr:hypothetical protein [Leisingera sp. ANG59]
MQLAQYLFFSLVGGFLVHFTSVALFLALSKVPGVIKAVFKKATECNMRPRIPAHELTY